ncbi:hypothetical protein [Aequorivita lipolytica]|uniref:Uncharacterized protein n=1 Tax=Aequorivita lipolytica TaxID=153267 RepID=A0A5C6YRB2_9FLAO|nr:hypothetical protein [Aequorivita lipolytica]TXD69890.1 hypothetical protein ESV24_05495 [Aequorivita lipolytica]SRX50290.1 hypothetical protein AEQU2_00761 [Aequorivita lipolytica]
MLTKISRFIEYIYIIAAVFFTYEAINTWSTDPNKAYLYIFFVVIAIFMFFFRRNFRKKIEKRNE